jgi:transcriptional regulator with XRE-family HTH domain
MPSSSLARFKRLALARADVREAYDELEDEFALFDELLKARAALGLTQAEVADRVGTSQSAIARLESAEHRHSPSIATLQRYARALGCRLEIRLVKPSRRVRRADGERRRPGARHSR